MPPDHTIPLRIWVAMHAPAAPGYFSHKRWSEKTIVPAPEMGKGWVTDKWIEKQESNLDREIRWRFEYADAVIKAYESGTNKEAVSKVP